MPGEHVAGGDAGLKAVSKFLEWPGAEFGAAEDEESADRLGHIRAERI